MNRLYTPTVFTIPGAYYLGAGNMIIHIDMDAFFASVEQRDNPLLQGKCVIVGGSYNRGVVSTASYEARKFGIHSAMPVYMAKQKCPHAIFRSPRMAHYKEISRQIMSVLERFSPQVEPVSIDEAYLDITGCRRLYGNPGDLGAEIKKEIKDRINLSCTVGIAPNKFLAKIASDMDKPDGLTLISPENALHVIQALPVEKVSGVGKKKTQELRLIGINTLGDVKMFPEKMLVKKLGKFGQRLIQLSNGIDEAPVVPFSPCKSVSSEQTLPVDTGDMALLNHYLLVQAESVGRALRKLNVRARTITLKIKHDDFNQVTRSTTVSDPSQSAETVYSEAARLLADYKITKKIRLIGVGASNLVPAATPVQMDLFASRGNQNRNWEKLDRVLDSISEKYGRAVVRRATLGAL
jgi:DNA polymerase-4